MGAFPVWRPDLDELDVDSVPASAFLILKSFKIIPPQLSCRVPARVLASLLSDGPGTQRKTQGRASTIRVSRSPITSWSEEVCSTPSQVVD